MFRGYLAPEYMLGGKLTKKADVFSFGVLILEIVSGRSSGKTSWGEIQKLLLEWVSLYFPIMKCKSCFSSAGHHNAVPLSHTQQLCMYLTLNTIYRDTFSSDVDGSFS